MCNKCGKRGDYATTRKYPDRNSTTTVKRLTENMKKPDESISKPDESFHRMKEIKQIEEMNEHYIANLKINGLKML